MLTVTMLSRFKRSFSKDNEGQIFSATSERRSYLNVREFLDDLDVRSTVSNVQSEYGRKKSNKKRLSSRKSSILNIFSQVNNKFSDRGNGSSSFNCNGLRSVSMQTLSLVHDSPQGLTKDENHDHQPKQQPSNLHKSSSISMMPPHPTLVTNQKQTSLKKSSHLLDLEIHSAELQYQIEKYKLEIINLQQNIKSCKKAARKRIMTLFDIVDTKKNITDMAPILLTAELHSHQTGFLQMSRNILESKVDLLTGKLLPVPDKILEISGHDTLSLDTESWNKLQGELTFPTKVVILRKQPRDLQRNLKSDIDDMQKLLERKLQDAKKAHAELRVVIRENLELEQENLRLNHRVAYLEDQCGGLRKGLVQIQTSLNTCLNHELGTCGTCPRERCDSRATSGVFSAPESLPDSLSNGSPSPPARFAAPPKPARSNVRSNQQQSLTNLQNWSEKPELKHNLWALADKNNKKKTPYYKSRSASSVHHLHLAPVTAQENENKSNILV